MSVDIVYETHSVSEDNERGIATGWLDGRLSARGRELSLELGQRRGDDHLAVVITSDLGRAVETAEIAFAATNIPIVRDTRLRECNYGAWNGMPVAQLAAERMRRIDTPYPDGESYRQVVTRVAAFLTELARDHEGERVCLIGHSATKWALDYLLMDIPLERLVSQPFNWREGWFYTLPTRWTRKL